MQEEKCNGQPVVIQNRTIRLFVSATRKGQKNDVDGVKNNLASKESQRHQ
jgi:hypothetical protein